MKKLGFIAIFMCSLLLTSCMETGEVHEAQINYTDSNLPPELQGLKVYRVGTGYGDDIQIAVLDNKVVGTSYTEGKYTEYVAVINKGEANERVIEAKEIISETDSVIVLKK